MGETDSFDALKNLVLLGNNQGLGSATMLSWIFYVIVIFFVAWLVFTFGLYAKFMTLVDPSSHATDGDMTGGSVGALGTISTQQAAALISKSLRSGTINDYAFSGFQSNMVPVINGKIQKFDNSPGISVAQGSNVSSKQILGFAQQQM